MGRFPRPLENRLLTPSQWLEDQNVVSDDSTMMMAMSLMFLFVCLLNTVGLLLAKFLGKSAEIGVRQALGASKQSLFSQYIVEASCIGFAGGILGLFLAWLGLKGIVILYGDMMQDLAKLDTNMVIAAVGMAVLTSIIAGVYPTWRASSIQPASQLKSQ
jgi:putative ABC transport system permease protein